VKKIIAMFVIVFSCMLIASCDFIGTAQAQSSPAPTGGLELIGTIELSRTTNFHKVRDTQNNQVCYVIQSNYGGSVWCR